MSAQSTPSTESSLPPNRHRPRGKTKIARKVDWLLITIKEPIGVLGAHLLGSWWGQILSAVQDAIAIGCLLRIPSLVLSVVAGEDSFSSLTSCSTNFALSDPNIVACAAIVASDYCFWILFLGRTIARAIDQARSKE